MSEAKQSETSATTHKTMWYQNFEDCNPNIHCSENLKFHILITSSVC